MPRKPSEPNSKDSDEADFPETPNSVNESFDETESPEEENGEFTLDQLSQAYAKVLKDRGQLAEPPEPPNSPSDIADEPACDASPRGSLEADDIDEIDNAPCAITPASILEAILFVGAPNTEKLTAHKIASILRDVTPKDVKNLIKELNNSYAKTGAAFRIVKHSVGGYRMELEPQLSELQLRFYGRLRQATLSQGAIDVLAVVAYNQPATREQVDKIRAKSSGAILAQMVKRDLLTAEATDSKPRRQQYRTTDRFLELFGLDSIDDLPQTNSVSDIDELAD